MKILLLEDDELFASSLIDFLEDGGFCPELAVDGEQLLELSYLYSYDLYLFDINVPKINGLELLKQLRESGDNTPTIFLTSYKDKDTLLEGFDSGADDYLVKPVDLDELMLRIRALLKRSGKQLSNIKIDNLEFNPNTKSILQDGEELKLPMKVVELFELFCENRGKIVSKEQIINRLWSRADDFSDGSIRVYINKIKQLFKDHLITNIKGVGYKIEF
jgi:DNA-binding response OmpR family regulator